METVESYKYSIILYILTALAYITLVFDAMLAFIVVRLIQLRNELSYEYSAASLVYFQRLMVSSIIALLFLKYFRAKSVSVTDSQIIIKNIFNRANIISIKDIKFIDTLERKNIFSVISMGKIKQLEHIIIYTLDKKFDINVSLLSNGSLFRKRLDTVFFEKDEYIRIYLSQRSRFDIYNIFSNPTGMAGIILVGITLFYYIWGGIATIFYPPGVVNSRSFYLYNPDYAFGFNDPRKYDGPPSASFPLGNDFVGRDYYSRIVYGMFTTLNIAITVSLIAITIAIIVGTISGMNNRVGNILQGLMDGIIAIPVMIFWTFGLVYSGGLRAIEGVKIEGGFFWNIMIITALFVWAGPAKLIRAEIIQIRNKEYMHAQRVFGASKLHMFRKHIIPGILPTVMNLFLGLLVDFIGMIIAIAVLIPSDGTLVWGSDLNRRLDVNYYETQDIFDTYFMFATLIFSITIFGFLLLGNALKDIASQTE